MGSACTWIRSVCGKRLIENRSLQIGSKSWTHTKRRGKGKSCVSFARGLQKLMINFFAILDTLDP